MNPIDPSIGNRIPNSQAMNALACQSSTVHSRSWPKGNTHRKGNGVRAGAVWSTWTVIGDFVSVSIGIGTDRLFPKHTFDKNFCSRRCKLKSSQPNLVNHSSVVRFLTIGIPRCVRNEKLNLQLHHGRACAAFILL